MAKTIKINSNIFYEIILVGKGHSDRPKEDGRIWRGNGNCEEAN
jgi:hypothetical protein